MTDENKEKSRLKKGLYYGANTLLPLSELRNMTQTIVDSASNHLKKTNPSLVINRLRPSKVLEEKLKEPELTFEQALNASGCTIEELTQRFLGRKRMCLVIMTPLVLFTFFLVIALFVNGAITGWLLAKAISYLCAMTAIIALLFTQAMIASWRIWQLKHKRATELDQGTFLDFKKTNYIRQTLNFFR